MRLFELNPISFTTYYLTESERRDLEEGKIWDAIKGGFSKLKDMFSKKGIKLAVIAGGMFTSLLLSGEALAHGFDQCGWKDQDTIMCQMNDGTGISMKGMYGKSNQQIAQDIEGMWQIFQQNHTYQNGRWMPRGKNPGGITWNGPRQGPNQYPNQYPQQGYDPMAAQMQGLLLQMMSRSIGKNGSGIGRILGAAGGCGSRNAC